MAGFSGSRTISLSKLEMVLILEGLAHVRTLARQGTGDMADFKQVAVENTITHVETVKAKLERDQQAAELERGRR